MMHAWVFVVVVGWHVVLAAVLVGFSLRTRRLVDRIVALDAFALVVVAVLVVLAVARRAAHDLDVALVLAMLGFAQTVATARVLQRRKDLR